MHGDRSYTQNSAGRFKGLNVIERFGIITKLKFCDGRIIVCQISGGCTPVIVRYLNKPKSKLVFITIECRFIISHHQFLFSNTDPYGSLRFLLSSIDNVTDNKLNHSNHGYDSYNDYTLIVTVVVHEP